MKEVVPTIKIRSSKDFYAALLFIALGAAVIWLSQNYPIGTAQRMGPGYFPTILGVLLAAIGMGVLGQAFTISRPPVARFALKPLLLVLGAVAAFALLVQSAGLVVSTVVLLFVSALAGHEFRLREVLTMVVLLATASTAVFAVGLQLQFKVWPW